MAIACERCGRQLAGIVCTKCGNVSTTPYSCSHCGFAFGATLCATCSQSLTSYPRRTRTSSEMKTICRNVAIILPIALISLIILLVILGGI